jgi:DNA-binding LacI/PurR family transcriptional regulator
VAASISDVAALAGVSRATVSHTISGNRYVGPEKKAQVLAAMAELGYVPSRSARSLALGTTQLIGLLLPDISNGFFAVLAQGVETTAIERGYNVLIGNTGFDQARERFYLEMIRSRAVDGILYVAGAAFPNHELTAAVADIPLVFVDEELDDSAGYAIVSDNFDGGRQVAEKLLSLGHRRALVIAGPESLLSSTRRVDGFAAAWSAGGGAIEYDRDSFTFEGGYASAERNTRALQDGSLTAVFAVNDLMALGVIAWMRTHDLRAPNDISVVGFDDTPVAQYSAPRLTTVRQDIWGLGARSATVLIDSLISRKPLPVRREIQPVTFVEGETVWPIEGTTE